MFRYGSHATAGGLVLVALFTFTGCKSAMTWGSSCCDSGYCDGGSCDSDKWKLGKGLGKSKGHGSDCEAGLEDWGSDQCQSCDDGGKLKKSWGKCKDCAKSGCLSGGCCSSCLAHRSLAIPEIYPVGAVQRAHFHQMQTNAEAMDFVLFQRDFVLDSAELTPDGKDRILEIAARMRSAPFPVIVERTWNNADPELDAHRRAIVAQILTDFGNPDANNRTFVSNAYGPGKHALEASPEFYHYTYQGLDFTQFGAAGGGIFGAGGGGGGGFGGGGGAGGGFGGIGAFGF